MQDIVTRSATAAIAAATDDALLDTAAARATRPAGLLSGVSGTTLSGTIGEQTALVLDALSGARAPSQDSRGSKRDRVSGP